ncbi:Protein OS-9 [Dissophora globulifera]|uniref:Protein OS-9 homolog n=1 Tax=Dissophora globulifera TaxID=979702 RepID=A0A9P6RN05_9FUNG|nr:Protein OS-9 [Dissophora globulifera]
MVRLSSVAVAVTALVKTSSVLVTTTASLFLFVQSTTGLSTSFVYNDPFAQPHYHVQNHENTILASKVRSLEGVMTMTQPGGQRWACFMPPPAEMPPHTPSKTSQELEEEDSATIQRGLALLESLAGRCLQGTFEWWTYDFCYKKHIRQYRAVSVGDLLFPESEDWVFILSRYIPLSADNKQSDRHMVKLDESPSRHQALRPTSFNKDTAWTTELDFYQDRNILIQRWEQGDICPYTNLPRQVKVQVR